MAPWPFGGVFGLAVKLHRYMNPLYKEFCKAYTTLDRESRRMISSARSDPQLDKRKDLLALFLQEEARDQRSNGLASAAGTSSTMTSEWLRDVVLNFIIAGRDTTACTLSWMFYILATNAEIQQKLQAEIDAKFKWGSVPTIQSVSHNELPYLNGVLYETLRLYPPVPNNGKGVVNDAVLPSGERIPAGSHVTYLTYAMGRDEKLYPEPEVVKPERWIPFREPSPYQFPVFQAGRRVCLGQNMALFEAKIAAAMILREYSFEMAPGEADKITYLPAALTLSIVNTKGAENMQDGVSSRNLWLVPTARH